MSLSDSSDFFPHLTYATKNSDRVQDVIIMTNNLSNFRLWNITNASKCADAYGLDPKTSNCRI